MGTMKLEVRDFPTDMTEVPLDELVGFANFGVPGALQELRRREKELVKTVEKAPRAAVNNALAMLDNLPTVETRDGKELIAAPWPVAERPNLDPDMWIDSVITDVPIVDLFATQTVLNRERVAEFVQNPGAIENGRRALANVYDNGRMLIVDGHHRLAAYWLLGAERANVWYLVES